MRIKIAFSYLQPIASAWTKPSERDIDLAWRLGKEAEADESKSRLETWLCHWLMAFLYAWHDEDFARAVAEAAIQLVPYDAISRAALAGPLTNAGRLDEAIEWSNGSIGRDPAGLEWGTANLAWAYYLAGRYQEASAELQKLHEPWPLLQAAVDVRLGRIDQARVVVADFLKNSPVYAPGGPRRGSRCRSRSSRHISTTCAERACGRNSLSRPTHARVTDLDRGSSGS